MSWGLAKPAWCSVIHFDLRQVVGVITCMCGVVWHGMMSCCDGVVWCGCLAGGSVDPQLTNPHLLPLSWLLLLLLQVADVARLLASRLIIPLFITSTVLMAAAGPHPHLLLPLMVSLVAFLTPVPPEVRPVATSSTAAQQHSYMLPMDSQKAECPASSLVVI